MSDNREARVRAMRIVTRFVEGLTLEAHIEHDGRTPNLLEVTLACEMMASLQRRVVRDLGIPKEETRAVQALASQICGVAYEESGMGKAVRAQREAEAAAAPDSSFSRERWEAAGDVAANAIAAALGQEKKP